MIREGGVGVEKVKLKETEKRATPLCHMRKR